jgi:hypothetical protein
MKMKAANWPTGQLARTGFAACVVAVFALLFAATTQAAAPATDPLLRIPNFDSLVDKAEETVTITLDTSLLSMAAKFLDPKNPEDAAVKEVIGGLKGIYVRSFTFDSDFAYPEKEVDAVRKQLTAPGWQQLVQVRNRKEQSKVDIYLLSDGQRASGLAIIASEPREFTIVNIVGSIDLDKLHKLEGRFGVPKVDTKP